MKKKGYDRDDYGGSYGNYGGYENNGGYANYGGYNNNYGGGYDRDDYIGWREGQKKGAAPAEGADPYPVHPAHSGSPASAAVIAAQNAPVPLPAPIDNIKFEA